MNNIDLTKDETELIKEMISVFLFEYTSIQDVSLDDNNCAYTYDHDGNRVTENYEVTRYKLIHSLESKLKS